MISKEDLISQIERITKALSSRSRLKILDILTQGPRTVEELAKDCNLSVANTSQHLKVLYTARLVDFEKRGLYAVYRLTSSSVAHLFVHLRNLSERQLLEIDSIKKEFLRDRSRFVPVDEETLLDMLRDGEVLLIDVRPRKEYEAAHIKFALSIPLDELKTKVKDLPGYKPIVAYCRGPYCMLAKDAVDFLTAHGFRAYQLESGVIEWEMKGLPVERKLDSGV